MKLSEHPDLFLFPFLNLPELGRIRFKMPVICLKKENTVIVAGPIMAVLQGFFFFHFLDTYQNNVAFQNAPNMTSAVSWTHGPSWTNKDSALCLFLTCYL